MKISHRILLFFVIIQVSFVFWAIADSNPIPPTNYQTNEQQDSISEQAAVSIAQKKITGRVLAIRLENNVYRIKILSDQSTVHIVAVNAINGKIMPAR